MRAERAQLVRLVLLLADVDVDLLRLAAGISRLRVVVNLVDLLLLLELLLLIARAPLLLRLSRCRLRRRRRLARRARRLALRARRCPACLHERVHTALQPAAPGRHAPRLAPAQPAPAWRAARASSTRV